MAIRKSASAASSASTTERSPILFMQDQFGNDLGFIALSEANIARERDRKDQAGKPDPRGAARAETLALHRALCDQDVYETGQEIQIAARVFIPGQTRKVPTLQERIEAARAHMEVLKAEKDEEAAVA